LTSPNSPSFLQNFPSNSSNSSTINTQNTTIFSNSSSNLPPPFYFLKKKKDFYSALKSCPKMFKNFKFCITNCNKKVKEEISKTIVFLGGFVFKKYDEFVTHLLTPFQRV
jgi:hypothetical protein